MKNRAFHILLGLAVSALCLWLAVRHVPFRAFLQSLSSVNAGWVAASVFALLLNVLARAERWRGILGEGARFPSVFWSQSIGALFTNIFPLRAGEVARVAALSRSAGVPAARVAASAVAERVLDMFSVLACLALAIPFMDVPGFVKKAAAGLGAAGLAGAGLMLLLVFRGGLVESWIRRLTDKSAALRKRDFPRHWASLREGFAAFLRPSVLVRAVLGSAAVWVLAVASAWCLLRAFTPEAAWVEALFMTVALSLAVAVPASPGSLGVFQYVGMQALVVPFGGKYAPAAAFSAALLFHVDYYVFSCLTGAAGLLSLDLPLLSLREKAAAVEAA